MFLEVEFLDQKVNTYIVLLDVAKLPCIRVEPVCIPTAMDERACSPQPANRVFCHTV